MSMTAPRIYLDKQIVGISDMKIAFESHMLLETHALGSCIGVAAYDEQAGVGGLLHFQLPLARMHPEKAARNPFMFGDTGLTAMLDELFRLGAARKSLVVKLAGGAAVADPGGTFNIGQRNLTVVKKLLWKNGIFIAAEEVGANHWRNMRLEIASGRVWVKDARGEFELQTR